MSNRSARIDRVHNEEIRTEIAERLRIFLSKDQFAMPTRFRKQLNDLVRKEEESPSIVPEAGPDGLCVPSDHRNEGIQTRLVKVEGWKNIYRI
jgi:hypothetical protein